MYSTPSATYQSLHNNYTYNYYHYYYYYNYYYNNYYYLHYYKHLTHLLYVFYTVGYLSVIAQQLHVQLLPLLLLQLLQQQLLHISHTPSVYILHPGLPVSHYTTTTRTTTTTTTTTTTITTTYTNYTYLTHLLCIFHTLSVITQQQYCYCCY